MVITDRYLDSSLAYQAGGRELTAAEIRNLSMWATNGLLPERTYLLDMDPAQSHARLQHAEDRMEAAGNDFQRRTRVAFLDLAEREPERFHVIDASQSIEDVWARIKADFDTVSTAGRGVSHERVELHSRPSAGGRTAEGHRQRRPEAIAQSWLICGPPGSGRSNVARAFAAALESPDHGLNDEPTKTTEQVLAGTHPDVSVLATNKVTIGIDEVRDIITTSEQMPGTAPWRIIIIETSTA